MKNFVIKVTEEEISTIESLKDSDFQNLENAIVSYDPFSLFEVNPHNNKEIICPLCGNGSGDSHTGVKINSDNGHYIFHCFKPNCNFSGDLIEVIAKENCLSKKGNEYYKILAIGARIINYNYDMQYTTNKKIKKDSPKSKSKSDSESKAELEKIQSDIKEA